MFDDNLDGKLVAEIRADTAVASALSNVPKAVAAGIVDMDTGMLLAIKTTESHPQAVLEMVPARHQRML